MGTKEHGLQSIVMHNIWAITPTGMPLGTLHQQLWVQAKEERHARPIEEKESYKWIESLKAITPHIPPKPNSLLFVIRKVMSTNYCMKPNKVRHHF